MTVMTKQVSVQPPSEKSGLLQRRQSQRGAAAPADTAESMEPQTMVSCAVSGAALEDKDTPLVRRLHVSCVVCVCVSVCLSVFCGCGRVKGVGGWRGGVWRVLGRGGGACAAAFFQMCVFVCVCMCVCVCNMIYMRRC